ncbi:2-C-methyl-D-erythritol 4-phosphate cytidylyltransferase [Sesbania bispinosa]|nr:2-C-methyl-D-erythritol 4-phosphate cytidylyltransferase [Sesbania bispinosa]
MAPNYGSPRNQVLNTSMTQNIKHLACVMERPTPPIHDTMKVTTEKGRGKITEPPRGSTFNIASPQQCRCDEPTTSAALELATLLLLVWRKLRALEIPHELLDKHDDAPPEIKIGETFSSSKGFTDSKLPK